MEIVSFMTLAAIIGGFLSWYNSRDFLAASPLATAQNFDNEIIPTPLPRISFTSQISPDGTHDLSMTKTVRTDGTSRYLFTVEDKESNEKNIVFDTIVPQSEDFSIPFNTWSPDDYYFFIRKNQEDALVFKADGAPINGEQYLSVISTFGEKEIPATPRDITGWASTRLLIVNALPTDTGKEVSYWYEVPSKAIIRLYSLFE